MTLPKLTITDESEQLKKFDSKGNFIYVTKDSLGTSSSKITVDIKSDGLGNSLYGSINSSFKKVEKNKSNSSIESSTDKPIHL